MGFWDEVRKTYVEKRAEIAARKEQSRALVPVSRGEVVPSSRRSDVVPSGRGLPAARHRGDLQPADRPEDVTEYGGAEIVASAPLFRFEVWCAKSGRPFIAVAERHGDTLLIVGNEKPDGTAAGSGWPSGYQYFAIDAAPAWRCPWCGTREDERHDFLRLVWACGDPACGEPLHCCGSRRGVFRCACGQMARREFARADVFKVREFAGLRGPDGRGEMCSCPREDGGVAFATYRGASTGSLMRR
jgi:hypothetical protein